MAMKKMVETWVSDDGKEYPTEIQALRADATYWQKRCEVFERAHAARASKEPQSSYGSSGGGGHD